MMPAVLPCTDRSPVEIIQILADAIADGSDHPEVWDALVTLDQAGGRESLGQLAYLLSEVLRAPQEQEARRVLSILHAVVLGQLGKFEAATLKLAELCTGDDRTASGALAHVQSLRSSQNGSVSFVHDLVASHGGVST